jgi:hypothetical protein
MANTFKNYFLQASSASANVIVGPSATQTTVIGMSIANVTENPILANVTVTSAGNTYLMIYKSQIPVGSTLVPIGSNQKLVLEDGDYVRVDTSGDAHVIASGVEITN